MSINRRLQQQTLLNKKLQSLVTASAKKADSLEVEITDVIKTPALTSALAAKANVSHTHTLSNLTQSGATLNQVPQWSGSAWVPATVSGGSSPSNLDGGNASSTPVIGLTYDGGSA